jgi:hypothetical protein
LFASLYDFWDLRLSARLDCGEYFGVGSSVSRRPVARSIALAMAAIGAGATAA